MEPVHDLGYVLHAVHYQETSAIVRLLTREHGLVSGVLRGVYQNNKKSAPMRAAIQMGNRIECEWAGKSSLKTFYRFEQQKAVVLVDTQKFVCLSYIHELLMYFLQENIAVEAIFCAYKNFQEELMSGEIESSLRRFELDLLDELGYGMDLTWDSDAQEAISPDYFYTVIPGHGVRECSAETCGAVYGADLFAFQQRNFSLPSTLLAAKKINRKILAYYMDNKPLKARAMYSELFPR
jgi:DNA repair protein RecO (recombination protein O)